MSERASRELNDRERIDELNNLQTNTAAKREALVLERAHDLVGHVHGLAEEKKLREAAYSVEHLTRLKTREFFMKEFEHALALIRGEVKERRDGVEAFSEVSVVMLDLDHFKQVNDKFGHAGGDAALLGVSTALLEMARSGDTVARYGGEEIIILMCGATATIAHDRAEDMRAKIQNLSFDKYPEMHVTASFGIASSKQATDSGALVELADQALYKSKNSGRNRVTVSDASRTL